MTIDQESARNKNRLPLTNLVVLDLTLARAGPTCVRHLADWGADVIRVLPPDAPGGAAAEYRQTSDYQNLHRNKRGITLDLKSPAGHATLLELVRCADVLVENMRVQVKHRLKIAWEDLRELNPRLVYGSISGFGQTGPYAARAGVDQIAQGMGGLMSITGEPGRGPMRAGIAVADMTAGNLLALAIMMALFERERTGVGRWVHTSLLESQIFMLDFQAARYLMDGEVPGQAGNGHPTLVPMGAFPTSDGHVNIAPVSPRQWRTFCEQLGRTEWLDNPSWSTYTGRLRERASIDAVIAQHTREHSTAYWVEHLEQAGIPCGPIYAMDEVFADPQVEHLEMAAPLTHPQRGPTHLVNSPLNFEGTAKRIRSAAESVVSRAEEVLDELRPASSIGCAAVENISWVERARVDSSNAAVVDGIGTHSYADLLAASARIAAGLLAGRADLAGERVCFLVSPGFAYVATQWGIMRAGGVAVPLCVSHPPPELAHVLDDARPLLMVAEPEFEPRLGALLAERSLTRVTPAALLAHDQRSQALPRVEPERHALLIYTSGTTGKPKAVITSHAIFDAQQRSIVSAWELASTDRLLHCLPLHHLHGVLNALAAPLSVGACVEFMPQFDAAAVLARFTRAPALTVFMGVPTMYAKLVQAAELLPDAERAQLRAQLAQFRLIVSGSAALPVTLLSRFEAMSSHVLLERYGMTELGMALGNPLRGERRAGSVGVPFPGVEARIVDERGRALPDATPGELQIRGPNVFAGYFGRPDVTRAAFTDDGFFRTGDIAIRESGYYRLLGRESVDIIKTGGFKVSALEIEEALREHTAIADVAVVGLPDAEWGERVAAVIVWRTRDDALSLAQLRLFGKERLAPYKVPSLLFELGELPRNVMGKVNKPALVAALKQKATQP